MRSRYVARRHLRLLLFHTFELAVNQSLNRGSRLSVARHAVHKEGGPPEGENRRHSRR